VGFDRRGLLLIDRSPSGASITRTPIAAALLLSVSLPLGGCLVTSSNTVEESGVRVSESTLANVEPGRTTGAWPIATLGEPTSRTPVADQPGTEISYEHVRSERSAGAVFLILGGASSKSERSRVFFEVENGLVRRSWPEA
jgi:hypothetical protein